MKKFILLAFSSALLLANQNTHDQSYALGASTGNYIINQAYKQNQFGLKTDMSALLQGFTDALKKNLKMNDEQIITALNQRAKELNNLEKIAFEDVKAKNLKAQKEFFAKNAKNKAIHTLKSGLQYEILHSSKGEFPQEYSIVMVDYVGKTLKGDIFDSTYERKKPAKLSMINIIDGLREGLKLMHVGSKYRFFIPSSLAYKDAPIGLIEPESALIFEVELKNVLQPGEAEPIEIKGINPHH